MSRSSTAVLTDAHGHRLSLGKKIGSGGEGDVFLVPKHPESVAKVYKSPPAAEHLRKLEAMVSIGRDHRELPSIAAWPTSLIRSERNREPIGFLMPKLLDVRDIHELYTPKDRSNHFPKADWGFLLHTAINCADAFEKIHQHGHVVGDVNQSNVVVGTDSCVRLIDCDSMGVRAATKFFPATPVGIDAYTPPEFQGQALHNVQRNQNHDCFGLAVLLFQLLFVGRHPYSGSPRAKTPHGQSGFTDAIRNGDFAYSLKSTGNLAPPPGVPTLDLVPKSVGALFERAFSRSTKRPTAAAWCSSLRSLESQIKTCPTYKGHKYPSQHSVCPWCKLVNKGGTEYFFTAANQFAAWTPEADEFHAILNDAQNDLHLVEVPILPTWRRTAVVPTPVRLTLPAKPEPRLPPFKASAVNRYVPDQPVVGPPELPPPPIAPKLPARPISSVLPELHLPPEPVPRSSDSHVLKRESRLAEWSVASLHVVAVMAWLFPLTIPVFVVYYCGVLLHVWRLEKKNQFECEQNKANAEKEWASECTRLRESHEKRRSKLKSTHEDELAFWTAECNRLNSLHAQDSLQWEKEVNRRMTEHESQQQLATERWQEKNKEKLANYREIVQKEKFEWDWKSRQINKEWKLYNRARNSLLNEKRRREEAYERSRKLLANAETRFRVDAGRIKSEKTKLAAARMALKQRWDQLATEYHSKVKTAAEQDAQLRAWLQRHPIPHNLRGIPNTVRSELTFRGITTATDCNPESLLAVHGIGNKRMQDIMNWVRSVEMKFRYNPKLQSTDPARLRLNLEFGRKGLQLRQKAIQICTDLKQLREASRQVVEAASDHLEELNMQSERARQDLEFDIFKGL